MEASEGGRRECSIETGMECSESSVNGYNRGQCPRAQKSRIILVGTLAKERHEKLFSRIKNIGLNETNV
jgi:hypothetical protein